MSTTALVTRTPVTRTPRKRIKFEFWLDVNDPCQGELADWLAALKTLRLFHEVMRELVRWAVRILPTTKREIKATLRQGFASIQPAAATLPTAPQRELPAPTQPDEGLADKLEIAQSSKQVDRWGNFKILYNMLLSQYAHDPRHWDHFNADNLEYGLETGKFPPHLIKQAQTLLTERRRKQAPKEGAYALPQPPSIPEIKQIAGAARELPPPDDFEEDWL